MYAHALLKNKFNKVYQLFLQLSLPQVRCRSIVSILNPAVFLCPVLNAKEMVHVPRMYINITQPKIVNQ